MVKQSDVGIMELTNDAVSSKIKMVAGIIVENSIKSEQEDLDLGDRKITYIDHENCNGVNMFVPGAEHDEKVNTCQIVSETCQYVSETCQNISGTSQNISGTSQNISETSQNVSTVSQNVTENFSELEKKFSGDFKLQQSKGNDSFTVNNGKIDSAREITPVSLDAKNKGSADLSIDSCVKNEGTYGRIPRILLRDEKQMYIANDGENKLDLNMQDKTETFVEENECDKDINQRRICYRQDESGIIGMFLCSENNSNVNKVHQDKSSRNSLDEKSELAESNETLQNDQVLKMKDSTLSDQENIKTTKELVTGISKKDSESIYNDVAEYLKNTNNEGMNFFPSSESRKPPRNKADQFPKLLQFLSEPLVPQTDDDQRKIPLQDNSSRNSHVITQKDDKTKTLLQESDNTAVDKVTGGLPHSTTSFTTNSQSMASSSPPGTSKFPKLFGILTESIKTEPEEIPSSPDVSQTFDLGQTVGSHDTDNSNVNSSPTVNTDLYKFSNLLGVLSQRAVADRDKTEESPAIVKTSVETPLKKKIVKPQKLKQKKNQQKSSEPKRKVKKEKVDTEYGEVIPQKRLKCLRPEMYMPIIPKEHFTNKVGFVKEEEMLQVEDVRELVAPPLPLGLYQDKIKKEPNEETVDPSKPCSCNICGKVFVQFSDLEFHLRGHFGDRPYKCQLCERAFKHSANLYRHRRTHSGEKPYCCDICDKAFIDGTALRKHRRTHNPQKEFFCEVCNKGFVSKINLKHHKVIHREERPFICEYCNKGFNKNANLKSHMKVHFGFKPWKCETCGKTFPEKNRLKMHERIHWEDKPYKCNLCPAQFAQISNLYVHLRKHKGEKPFQCQQCGKSFMMQSYLKQHLRRHSGERQFKCAVCGKEYFQRGEFNRHMRTHTGEKTHFCSICNEGFIDSGSLKTHIRGIHEGKMYHCRFCNKEFLRDSNLRRHEAIHLGTKKHFCEKCGLGFLYAVELRDHMNKHTGFKPHTCDICGKKYYKMSELNQHKKIHTGEEMIYCEVCKKTFNYKLSYQKHLGSERHQRNERGAQDGEEETEPIKAKTPSKRKKKDNSGSSGEDINFDPERWTDVDISAENDRTDEENGNDDAEVNRKVKGQTHRSESPALTGTQIEYIF